MQEGSEEEYIRRHRDMQTEWPAVQDDMERAGVKEMSIWMEGNISYLYMRCENYERRPLLHSVLRECDLCSCVLVFRTTAALDASPESVKWEKSMEPLLTHGDGSEYNPEAAYPSGIPLIFRYASK